MTRDEGSNGRISQTRTSRNGSAVAGRHNVCVFNSRGAAGVDTEEALRLLFAPAAGIRHSEPDVRSLVATGQAMSRCGLIETAKRLARDCDIVVSQRSPDPAHEKHTELLAWLFDQSGKAAILVGDALSTRPAEFLAAVDFRRASLASLQLGRELLPDAVVHLVHVIERKGEHLPGAFDQAESDTVALLSAVGLNAGLERSRTVVSILPEGGPHAILEYAASRDIGVCTIGGRYRSRRPGLGRYLETLVGAQQMTLVASPS